MQPPDPPNESERDSATPCPRARQRRKPHREKCASEQTETARFWSQSREREGRRALLLVQMVNYWRPPKWARGGVCDRPLAARLSDVTPILRNGHLCRVFWPRCAFGDHKQWSDLLSELCGGFRKKISSLEHEGPLAMAGLGSGSSGSWIQKQQIGK